MANPVAFDTVSERHPERRVVTEPRRSRPKVIVESLRNVVVVAQLGQVGNLKTEIPKVTDRMNRVNLADHAGPEPRAPQADGIAGIAMIPELCDYLVLVVRSGAPL